METGKGTCERFAYRVSKDYGNVFYKDYLKMVLGNDFTGVMGYPDTVAEKCGDVIEMWLGMLDLANISSLPFPLQNGGGWGAYMAPLHHFMGIGGLKWGRTYHFVVICGFYLVLSFLF